MCVHQQDLGGHCNDILSLAIFHIFFFFFFPSYNLHSMNSKNVSTNMGGGAKTDVDCRFRSNWAVESTFIFVKKL